jgi:hypothetical protein
MSVYVYIYMYAIVLHSRMHDARDSRATEFHLRNASYNTVSGAGNGPANDDRSPDGAEGHGGINRASCSLPGPSYELSTTYTEIQRLTRRCNDLRRTA